MKEMPVRYKAPPQLSVNEFRKLGSFIHTKFGIRMPDSKRLMVESRLRRRLKKLEIGTFAQYCEYLFSNKGQDNELRHFIDVVTTNKTDFFREPRQFEYLLKTGLPKLAEEQKAGDQRKLMVWSSACSKGDEPYTLAMVLEEFTEKKMAFDYSILATDISMDVLEYAERGIYPHTHIEAVPLRLRQKYLLRSKNRHRDLVRIAPVLREKIMFRQINLVKSDFLPLDMMDIIFCRNVVIYFDRETTLTLLRRLCGKLRKGGLLFMGHSELLDCKKLPLVQIEPSIYQKN